MLEKVIGYCREAGIEILRFYGSESQVSYKEDKSPLTAADRASHDLLVRALEGQTPTIAVVSEESASETTIEPGQADNYWLVDPLDGTKEFLKQSGDFTVNVALIQGGQPVLGVVYVPAKEVA